MSNLRDYLSHTDQSKLFKPGEFTVPIRFTYTAIHSAVSDNADIFVVNPDGFEWYKQNVFIDKYLRDGVVMPVPGFNELIRKVLEYDIVLQRYLAISLESPDKTIISLHY